MSLTPNKEELVAELLDCYGDASMQRFLDEYDDREVIVDEWIAARIGNRVTYMKEFKDKNGYYPIDEGVN